MVESTLNLGGFLQHPLITSSLERASHTYAIISLFLGPSSVRTVDRPLRPHDGAKTLAWPCLSTFVNLAAADRLDFYNAIRAVQYTAIPFPHSLSSPLFFPQSPSPVEAREQGALLARILSLQNS